MSALFKSEFSVSFNYKYKSKKKYIRYKGKKKFKKEELQVDLNYRLSQIA